jgi:hypothetical protein
LGNRPLKYKFFAFAKISEGMIAFDYGAKTCRFGSGIDEAEENQILGRIREYQNV